MCLKGKTSATNFQEIELSSRAASVSFNTAYESWRKSLQCTEFIYVFYLIHFLPHEDDSNIELVTTFHFSSFSYHKPKQTLFIFIWFSSCFPSHWGGRASDKMLIVCIQCGCATQNQLTLNDTVLIAKNMLITAAFYFSKEMDVKTRNSVMYFISFMNRSGTELLIFV